MTNVAAVLREAGTIMPTTENPYVALLASLSDADPTGRLAVVFAMNRAFGAEWRTSQPYDIGQWQIAFELAALVEEDAKVHPA